MADHVEATGAFFAGFDVRLADHVRKRNSKAEFRRLKPIRTGSSNCRDISLRLPNRASRRLSGRSRHRRKSRLKVISLPVKCCGSRYPRGPGFRSQEPELPKVSHGQSIHEHLWPIRLRLQRPDHLGAGDGESEVTATHQNNVLISVRATAAQIQRALYTNLVYRLRRDGARSPPSIAIPRSTSTFLSYASAASTRLLHQPQGSTRICLPPLPIQGLARTNLSEALISRAACAAGATEIGNGQTVALVEFDDYFPGDVTAYRQSVRSAERPGEEEDTLTSSTGRRGKATAQGSRSISIWRCQWRQGWTPSSSTKANSQTTHLRKPLASPDGDICPLQVSASWNYNVDSTTQQLLKEMAVQGQSVFVTSARLRRLSCGSGHAQGHAVQHSRWRHGQHFDDRRRRILERRGRLASERRWNPDERSGNSKLSIGRHGQQRRFGSTFRNLPDVAAVASGVASAQNGTGVLGFTTRTRVSLP